MSLLSEAFGVGSLPAGWETSPLRAVATERRGNRNDGLVEENLLSLSYGSIVRKDINSDGGLLPESFEGYQIVEAGDLVMRLTDLQNDKRSLRSGLCNERGIITSAYLALEPTGIEPRYFAYLMRAYDTAKVLYPLGGGLRQSLKFEDVRMLPVLVPPVEEQRRIADFLDDQVARIDAVLRMHETQKGTIDELRITGLAQLMPEWSVPLRHEGTRRLATLLARNDGGVWGDEPTGGGDVVVVRSTEIDRFGAWRDLEDSALRSLSERDQQEARLLVGDIVVTKASGSPDHIGKAAIVNDAVAGMHACFGNFMQRLRVREDRASPMFVHRFLMSSLAREQFRVMSTTSTGLLNLSGGLLSDVRVPDIPLGEQARVVREVGRMDADLATLTGAIDRGIALLEERKRALITAAVTGELDVTTAKPIGMGKWMPNVGASVETPAAAQASGIGGIG